MNMIHGYILLNTFLNEPELFFLYTVKWFQVLLHNSHNSTSVICLHTVRSIWPINRILSSATSSGQNGPWSNGDEGVLHIPQSSGITGALPSDSLMS